MNSLTFCLFERQSNRLLSPSISSLPNTGGWSRLKVGLLLLSQVL